MKLEHTHDMAWVPAPPYLLHICRTLASDSPAPTEQPQHANAGQVELAERQLQDPEYDPVRSLLLSAQAAGVALTTAEAALDAKFQRAQQLIQQASSDPSCVLQEPFQQAVPQLKQDPKVSLLPAQLPCPLCLQG